MRSLRSLAGGLIRGYYVTLDYLLLFLSPVFRFLPGRATGTAIRMVNSLYFFWARLNGGMEEAHSSLETFRDTYDTYQGNFLDDYIGRNEWLTGRRILDLGCFVGGKTGWFVDHGAAEAVGIDLSERGISVARKYNRAGLRFEKVSSGDLAESEPESFDTVYSFTVFEHIEERLLPGVIEDCYRLLRPGGVCVIVYNHFFDRFGSHVMHFVRHAWPQALFREEHYQEYCDRELARMHAKGKYGYFPEGYSFRGAEHNKDSYMGLNKLSPENFRKILRASSFGEWREIAYSRSALSRAVSRFFPGLRLFESSIIYVLPKPRPGTG